MVSYVEVRIRHHDAAEQRRDGGFAVQWVRAVHDQPRLDGPLAGIFRIERRHHTLEIRHRCGATARGNDSRARRCRVDLDDARQRERLQEVFDELLVAGLDDHVQRVLAPNDGLALDLDALLPNVGTAEVVQERRARVRIHRRASFGLVVMANDEKSHRIPMNDDACAHPPPQGVARNRVVCPIAPSYAPPMLNRNFSAATPVSAWMRWRIRRQLGWARVL
jgi:hypothetical protein